MSYYRGSDRAKWVSAVPTYDSVRYRAAYPGIDLLFRGDGSGLAYDFVLQPGADPSQIQMAVEGVEALTLAPDGALLMTLPDGRELRQRAPVIYQVIGDKRVLVEGRFEILVPRSGESSPTFGFQIAEHDPSYKLVIDPTLDYSTYVGGTRDDDARVITVTAGGQAIVAGSTSSSEFPVGGSTTASGDDALVYQVSADGSALDYVVVLGGSDDEQINGVALDPDTGALYLTGETSSEDFPVQAALYAVLPGGRAQAAFVAKLANDQTVEFATYFGGSSADTGQAIGIEYDEAGVAESLYIAGGTRSDDMVMRNALYDRSAGRTDGFLLKLSKDGQTLQSSTYFGGSGDDVIKFMDINADGIAYLMGETKSGDLPLRNEIQQSGGGTDVFLARIARAGLEVVSSTYLGGSGADIPTGMILDDERNIFLCGYTTSDDFPVENALYETHAGGGNDAFVAKFDHSATFLHFSTFLGGSADDRALGLTLDQVDDQDTFSQDLKYLYVVGDTESNNFPAENAFQNYYAGGVDGFIVKLHPWGLSLISSSYFGGTDEDSITAIAASRTEAQRVFLAGNTESEALFPLSETPAFAELSGRTDSFVAALSSVDYDPFDPTIAVETKQVTPELLDPSELEVQLTLSKNSWYDDLSAFSTRLHYDSSALEYLDVAWSGPAPGGTQPEEARIDSSVDGELYLEIYQDAAPVPLEGITATIKFGFIEVGSTDDDPLESGQLMLTLDQPWAADMRGLDTFVRGIPGGIFVDRRRNAVLGDCDVSGRVRLWEAQRAVDYLSAGLESPACMTRDYVMMTVTDLQEIINGYLDGGVGAGLESPVAFAPPALAAQASEAALTFDSARLEGGVIRVDLMLTSGGYEVSGLLSDITYDPALFPSVDAVVGPAASLAGKGVIANVVEPGWLRVLVYSVSKAVISDGVVATLALMPGGGLGLADANLLQASSASTPEAREVSLQGSALLAGESQGPRDDLWRVAEIYAATMGYAPDNEGLQYWLSRVADAPDWTPTTVAQSFFDQPLVQAEYPEALGYESLVDALYQNLFGRAADVSGKAYWLLELSSGRIRRNEMIIAMINGGWANLEAAQDMARFGNRIQVALAFAEHQAGLSVVYSTLSSDDQMALRAAGREVLATVGSDAASREAAIAAIPVLLSQALTGSALE
ncbi:SBBP repeat-containing protein [Thiorhodococcus minor]|uniref:DUF4214 domain-containing protein n=1 Tax=Thiorhodococcus minor TaxID=57489 RepID=A0A6M0K623_9GAMM|nr:SBBP repeat-containing protein [Thiorhodococcus minor]NEV65190.1 DUF4214 domain-containing protein [Thiorhodococcus minor]